MITENSKILITGHKGLVGSSIIRVFKSLGYKKLITIDKKKLNLKNQKEVSLFFKKNKFDAVINAAAKVGGILANNQFKADFINENIVIQSNVINACYENRVKDLIFLGSSCIYPKNSKQPIKEEYLLTGELEKTNEPYAIAKIAGIKTCESFNFQYQTNFKCLMPCNLYGPGDNYDEHSSHFYPALLKKIYFAKKNKSKSILIWGSGKPKRELMYVDDFAYACNFFLKKGTKKTLINVGYGKDFSILYFAKFLLKKMNVKLIIKKDTSKPDGVKRKILDSGYARKMGWKPKIDINRGFVQTYSDFLKRYG